MSYIYDPSRGYLPVNVNVNPQRGVILSPTVGPPVLERPTTPVRPGTPVYSYNVGRRVSPINRPISPAQNRPMSPVLNRSVNPIANRTAW